MVRYEEETKRLQAENLELRNRLIAAAQAEPAVSARTAIAELVDGNGKLSMTCHYQTNGMDSQCFLDCTGHTSLIRSPLVAKFPSMLLLRKDS